MAPVARNRRTSTSSLSEIVTTSSTPSTAYPPIYSIPLTSPSRLSHPSARPTPFPTDPTPPTNLTGPARPKTVLYLAYGSNLSAETFLGVRKVRPISQVNVSCPGLRLTFDLPGVPYREPCFANTALRKLPKLPDPPKLPPGTPDLPYPPKPPHNTDNIHGGDADEVEGKTYPGDPVWNNGLIGVVYEVTQEDYAHIVATEGGGASYTDILVPCLPLPARMGVPEKPDYPQLPKPFLAHTLFAPRVPSVPGGGEGHKGKDAGDDEERDGDGNGGWWEKMPTWIKKLLLPVTRPEEDYAQPSARYLKLIRDGAREHELPEEYQGYLARLQPYTMTSWRQRIGSLLLLLLWAVPFLFFILVPRLITDDKGRVPRWVAATMAVIFNLVWLSYDAVFKPVFGDGERTVDADNERSGSWWRKRSGEVRLEDEEKRMVL
jgi:hypothetical protein